MMHNFLSNNRSELIERCRLRVVARSSFTHASERLETGIALFLDQLIVTLRVEQGSDPLTSRAISGPSLGSNDASEMGASAGQYANKLQLLDVSIEEVVHHYGDLCQVIMALARERDVPFLVDEYQTLNRCLDNAIAKAVMEFAYQRGNADRSAQGKQDREDTAALVHELRNALSSATLAFEAAKKGNLNLNGATGTVLQRGLDSLRNLINRSLDELKGETDKGLSSEKFQLAGFIQDVAHAATLAAHVRDVAFTALPIEQGLAVWADRDELYSAVTNLVQNGFKFTKPNTEVELVAYAAGDRILIEVRDHCGGLPPGSVATMFQPFTQQSKDKSGLGMGLSITKGIIESFDGNLTVTNRPGVGCIFTINLPRHSI